jgi:hypothetical protein
MHPRAGFCQGSPDGRIDGKLVAAGMHAELEVSRESVALHRKGDHAQAVLEFFAELLGVADIIDAFVKPTGEFRSDGLDWDLLIGDQGEDD